MWVRVRVGGEEEVAVSHTSRTGHGGSIERRGSQICGCHAGNKRIVVIVVVPIPMAAAAAAS